MKASSPKAPAPTKSPRPAAVTGSGPTTTGTYRWWSFEEHAAFTAMGQAEVNVANGNLVVVGTDVAAGHVGVDLVLSRAYNSMSQYDVNGTDGSQPSIFGNGWTSNLDVHIALNAAGGIAVFDATGTRWDYAPNGEGGWIPPLGLYASLSYSGSNNEYYWTLKDGITYQFRAPTGCDVAALCGRIHYIYARNNNAYLHFSYGFSNPDIAFSHLSDVRVDTENGRELYLWVTPVNGHPLVTEAQYQPGYQSSYSYDNSGNLITYTAAPNNAAGTPPTIGYSYYPNGYQMQHIMSPLFANGHGAYIAFTYGGSLIAEVDLYGEVNPSSFDGITSGSLQSGPTGVVPYSAVQYTYGVNGWTYVSDSDGHQRRYQPNPDGSIANRMVYTGTQFLSLSTTWDTAAHNLISVIDARGAQTDSGYDSRGNLVVRAQPTVGVYAAGSHTVGPMRSTQRYVYDVFDNLVASCGPAWNHAHGSDYGSANNCAPGLAGVTTFAWMWIETEPLTRLYSMTDPTGYHYNWSYDPSAQGGIDYSLPTEVRGDRFTQDNSPGNIAITPDQTFSYDNHGNLACYSDGAGITSFAYDTMNRLTSISDPDDSTPSCGRPTGAYQATIYKTYYPNGQLKTMGGSAAHAAGMDTAYAYDLDGNGTSVTSYSGNQAAVTQQYFDGADRLIEVVKPHTSASDGVQDVSSAPWLTRYLIDNSGGGAISEAGISGTFYAHGHIYKVQELQSGAMADLRVYSHDAADRPLNVYNRVPGRGSTFWRSQSTTYDTIAPGRITSVADSGGNSELFSYDALGRVGYVQFTSAQSATPTRSYGFDEEGRRVLTHSATWGDEWRTYDQYTGRLLSDAEASGGGVSSPGQFTYAYFPNGWTRSTSFSGQALNGTLHDQWYGANQTVAGQHLYNGAGALLSTITNTYTPGKRLIRRADSTSSSAHVVTLDAYGRPQAVAMPAGAYSQMTYDVEGNITGFNAMTGHAVTNAYNERNELASSVWSVAGSIDQTYPNIRQHGLNGVMEHDSYGCPTRTTCSWTSNHEVVDGLAGVITASDIYSTSGDGDSASRFQYDTIGRLTTSTQNFSSSKFNITGTSTKTYDAEDRLTSDTYSNWAQPNGFCGQNANGPPPRMSNRTLTYEWGANGHPVRYSDSSRGTTETLQWEGDVLAFTTNSAGLLDDLKFGSVADYTPADSTYAGITFWDRDPFGAITSSHNATGFGVWTASSAAHGSCSIASSPRDSTGYAGPTAFGWSSAGSYRYQSNGLLLDYTADGFSDGFNNVNGIRTLTGDNPTWTVPDPYGGVPDAPETGKAYVYAGSNPASNTDSSGYLSSDQQTVLGAYLAQYNYPLSKEGDWPCTSFIVHAYQQALGIDFNALVRADHFFPGMNGYEAYYHAWNHPAERVANLHNFFRHLGELHAWDGYVNKQIGDVLFMVHVHVDVGKGHTATVWTEDDVHAALIASVAKGKASTVAEGTSDDTQHLSIDYFDEHLLANGYVIVAYARYGEKNRMAEFMAGVGNALALMDDTNGGWSTPGNENLRKY